jgi:hypothetical protein
MKCHKPKHCLKETYIGSKKFLGKPFEYEDFWLACHLCKMEVNNGKDSRGTDRLGKDKRQE